MKDKFNSTFKILSVQLQSASTHVHSKTPSRYKCRH